ncbi:hypothetical protein C8R44DRAFT_739096 [Mycena epipterygia]|nr:hypothetical protein C8R44DRAFT_739096 [Mycena epipterygia]
MENLPSYFRRLPFRRARSSTTAKKANDEDPHTVARNILKVALQALSSVAINIPFDASLGSVIDPFLDSVDRSEQIWSNVNVFGLAARIDVLTSIVPELAQNRPDQGRGVVEVLKRELQSITRDLDAARSQGKLEEFFNSDTAASSLAGHNMKLCQLIVASTRCPQHDPQIFITNHGHLVIGRSIAGGFGGAGGSGIHGGGFGGTGGSGDAGGRGEGPRFGTSEEGHTNCDNTSGGTSGTVGGGSGGPAIDPE